MFATDAAHPFPDIHEHIDESLRRKLHIAIALEETWRRATPKSESLPQSSDLRVPARWKNRTSLCIWGRPPQLREASAG